MKSMRGMGMYLNRKIFKPIFMKSHGIRLIHHLEIPTYQALKNTTLILLNHMSKVNSPFAQGSFLIEASAYSYVFLHTIIPIHVKKFLIAFFILFTVKCKVDVHKLNTHIRRDGE